MLTLSLKRLEADGIVSRTLHPMVPPRVGSALTALGQSLGGALVSLQQWAAAHREAISRHWLQASTKTVTEV